MTRCSVRRAKHKWRNLYQCPFIFMTQMNGKKEESNKKKKINLVDGDGESTRKDKLRESKTQ